MNFAACRREAFGLDRWDDLVDRFDEAWLWHRSDYLESIDFWLPQEDHSFVVLDESQKPLAVVPLRLSRYRAYRAVRVATLRSIGGPAIAGGLSAKQRARVTAFITERLLALARELGAMHIDLSCPPMAPALRGERCPRTNPLVWIGCQDTQSQTWVVDLRRPEDAIRKAYASGTREELNKIRREPFEVRRGQGEAGAATFHALIEATFKRRGRPPHPLSYIRHVFERFVDRGLARALFFARDGEVLAGNIAATYKGGCQYWFGAASGERMGGANRLLLDCQIVEARANGSDFFETGQAYLAGRDQVLRGISDFKRSFGSEIYPLFQGTIVTKPRAHAALALIKALRGHG